MIISHEHREYKRRWRLAGKNKYNGAFYYSKEIVKNIIPLVDTDRNWITVNLQGIGVEHSILFVHNNLHPEHYEWVKAYKDVVLVCGLPETAERMKDYGKAIYLPLSIDLEYVSQFKADPDPERFAFAGRPGKRTMGGAKVPASAEKLEGLPRQMMLERMAQIGNVYAVGRTALEAKALGCKVLPYDERFPDPDIWKPIDNRDAAKILQAELDRIDGKVKEDPEPAAESCPDESWTKAELTAYAYEAGIDVPKKATKKTIVELINERMD